MDCTKLLALDECGYFYNMDTCSRQCHFACVEKKHSGGSVVTGPKYYSATKDKCNDATHDSAIGDSADRVPTEFAGTRKLENTYTI